MAALTLIGTGVGINITLHGSANTKYSTDLDPSREADV